MKSQVEYISRRAEQTAGTPIIEQWVREITADGRTVEHGPFQSYLAAKEFINSRKPKKK